MEPLPIDAIVEDITDAVAQRGGVIIQSAPGSGKTTRIPPALLRFGGEVLALEPRRIAARMAARRVAFELGDELGGIVGYQVRFEQTAGPRTRLRYITEGILIRRMLADPQLRGVDCVVLDEFHERRIETDLALALLIRLRASSRPDLKIVIMSATLDTAPVARLLDAPVFESEGRLYDLAIEFTSYSAAPLEQQVAAAVERAPGDGHILAFLPGAAEIRNAARACEPVCARRGIRMHMLHGDLPAGEQNRAVDPSDARKLILSTNVAESSITIPGVTMVIDSGLARVAGDSPWTGLPTLSVQRISKASAQQRAGRAARTAPGRAIRLYTAEDYARRADHDSPEILRRELAPLCLDLRAAGVTRAADLAWVDAPPPQALEAAENLLRDLGALDMRGALTCKGRDMAALPLHPRIAGLVLEAAERGAATEGCRAAALLSSGARVAHIDLLHALEAPADRATDQAFRQLRSLVPRATTRAAHPDDALAQAVLLAFPDRVARRREGRNVQFAGGGSGMLMTDSAARLMVALDAEERSERALPLVRLICPIEPEWLLDFFPRSVTATTRVEWNREAERVETVSGILYDKLTIEESRTGAVYAEKAAALLAEKALEAGLERFVDAEELTSLLARIDFAAEHGPVRRIGPAELAAAMAEVCYGRRSFAELKQAASEVLRKLEQTAGAGALAEIAPERLKLPGGRSVRVHYEPGQPPWIASRLQDFFGMRETPRIARRAVPVVVRLLAPNQRPVQTTTDLLGFWEKLYPQMRRELSRKYPKHAWPEKP